MSKREKMATEARELAAAHGEADSAASGAGAVEIGEDLFPAAADQGTSRLTLQNSHFTLHASCFMLHASRFTLHASRFTLHASCFMLHASCFMLHASCFMPHDSRFTLHASFAPIFIVLVHLFLTSFLF